MRFDHRLHSESDPSVKSASHTGQTLISIFNENECDPQKLLSFRSNIKRGIERVSLSDLSLLSLLLCLLQSSHCLSDFLIKFGEIIEVLLDLI